MEQLLQQIFSGVSSGLIYGALGLALVMIYSATNQINFAQGEMATFSAFVAWFLLEKGVPYWPAFFLTLIFSFFIGILAERLFYKKVERSNEIVKVIVFIGLFLFFNGLSGFLFGYDFKSFASPFTNINSLKNPYIVPHQLGSIFILLILLISIFLFFKLTRLGLSMRASAEDAVASELMGIRSSWMLALAWGLASVIGAIAGMLVAPILFLDSNMMIIVLVYSMASLVLVGFSNPFGVLVGGLIIGVGENLLGNYIPFIGNELKLSATLCLVALILLIKPSGLFGKQIKERV